MSCYLVSIVSSFIAFIIGLIIGRFLNPCGNNEQKNVQEAEKGAYIKGLKYIISNEPDKAIAEFTRAVQINSDTVEIYINLGNLFRERGEIERAIRIHQSILLRPKLKEDVKKSALMDLGLDYSSAGIFDRAIGTLQELISLHPENLQAHRELEKLYEEEKNWEKAFIEAKICQKLSGTDASNLLAHIIVELGKELFNRGEIADSIKEFKRALSIDKNCTDAYLFLGDVYFSQEKLNQAISIWEKAIYLNLHFNHLAYEKLEKAYLKKNDYDHIEHIYNDVLNKNPSDCITRMFLAEYYYKKGLSHKAIQELKEALKFEPRSNIIKKRLGEMLLKEKFEKEAFIEYQTLISEMKSQRTYHCNKCGYQTLDVIWKCPQCKEWDTFIEEIY